MYIYNNYLLIIIFILEIVKVEIPPDPALNTPQTTQAVPIPLLGSLASQLCPHGPKDRCTPSQAQAMGQQVLGIMAVHETNKTLLPCKC